MAKTRRKTISAELDALLGRKSISQIPEIEWAAPAKVSADLNQLYASSTERNPQIAILRSLLSNQEARERLAEFASKPEVTLGLNYMRTGDAINRALEGSGKDPWALMVGISLPVWGKANRSIQLAASLQSDALFAQIEDKELHLRADVHRWIAPNPTIEPTGQVSPTSSTANALSSNWKHSTGERRPTPGSLDGN